MLKRNLSLRGLTRRLIRSRASNWLLLINNACKQWNFRLDLVWLVWGVILITYAYVNGVFWVELNVSFLFFFFFSVARVFSICRCKFRFSWIIFFYGLWICILRTTSFRFPIESKAFLFQILMPRMNTCLLLKTRFLTLEAAYTDNWRRFILRLPEWSIYLYNKRNIPCTSGYVIPNLCILRAFSANSTRARS